MAAPAEKGREIGVFPRTGMYTYHNANAGLSRGDASWIISRSDLVDISEHSLEFWKEGGNPPSGEALKTGALVDALVTEPSRYAELFDILDADRYPPRYAQKERESGKYLVKKKDLAKHAAMAGNLRCKYIEDWDMTVGEVIDECCETQVMAVTYYEACGVRVWLRVLIDALPEAANWLADVKTSRAMDPRAWHRALRYEAGLCVQTAFYMDVFNAASLGLSLNDFWYTPSHLHRASYFLHFVVGNTQPYQAAVRRPDDDFIIHGRMLYQDALAAYCDALHLGEWPGYPNRIEVIKFDQR